MKKKACTVFVFFLLTAGYAVCGGSQDNGGTSASKWPSATVTVYAAEAGGGLTDATSRVFGAAIQEATGQPVTYVTTLAGNGTVAYESVRTAQNDGNTLLFFHMGFFVKYFTGMYEYNPLQDFDLIAGMQAVAPYAMVVRSDSQFKTADDVAKYIRENPNTLSCGLELGATSHVMAGQFALDAGGSFKYVEAGSTTQKLAALLGGHIDITFSAASSVRQYSTNGDMRVLGILTADGKRDASFADWPTFVELGYPHTVWSVDYAVYGPKSMDPVLKQTIFDQYLQAVNSAAAKDALAKMNQPVFIQATPADSYNYISNRAESIKSVLKSINLLKNE